MPPKEVYPIAEKFFIGPLEDLINRIHKNGDADIVYWRFPYLNAIEDLNAFFSYFISNFGAGEKWRKFQKSALTVIEGSIQGKGGNEKSLTAGFLSLDAFYWVDENFNLFRRFADRHNSLYIVDVANICNHPDLLQKILNKSRDFLLRPDARQIRIIKGRVGAKSTIPLEERKALYPFLFDFFQEAKKYEDRSVGVIFVCQSDCSTQNPFKIEVDENRSFIVVEACFRIMNKTMNKVVGFNSSDDAVAIELYRRLKNTDPRNPDLVKRGIVSFDLFFEYQGSLLYPVSYNPEEFFFSRSIERGVPARLSSKDSGMGKSITLQGILDPRETNEAPLLFTSAPRTSSPSIPLSFSSAPRLKESSQKTPELQPLGRAEGILRSLPLSVPRLSETSLRFSEPARPLPFSLGPSRSEVESRDSGLLIPLRPVTPLTFKSGPTRDPSQDALERLAFSTSGRSE